MRGSDKIIEAENNLSLVSGCKQIFIVLDILSLIHSQDSSAATG